MFALPSKSHAPVFGGDNLSRATGALYHSCGHGVADSVRADAFFPGAQFIDLLCPRETVPHAHRQERPQACA